MGDNPGDYTISRMKTTGMVHRFIILLLFLAMLVTPCAAVHAKEGRCVFLC